MFLPLAMVQALADERQVGIGEAAAQGLRAVKAVGLNGRADGIGMDAKFLGNGANLPMFGVEPVSYTHLDVYKRQT